MFKDEITYVNFNDEEVTETVYFNLSKAEMIEMEISTPGGISSKYKKLLEDKDVASLVEAFKDLVSRSYGIRSEDGRRFIKNADATNEFLSSEIYSEFFMKLLNDPDYANRFIIGILPKVEGFDAVSELNKLKDSDEYQKLLAD